MEENKIMSVCSHIDYEDYLKLIELKKKTMLPLAELIRVAIKQMLENTPNEN